jgi:hypothetical protein
MMRGYCSSEEEARTALEKELGREVLLIPWQDTVDLLGDVTDQCIGDLADYYRRFEKTFKAGMSAGKGLISPPASSLPTKEVSSKTAEFGSLMIVECSFAKFSDYRIETLPELKRQIGEKTFVERNIQAVIGVKPVIMNETPETVSGVPLDTIHNTLLENDVLLEVLSLARDVDVGEGFNEATQEAIPTQEILGLCQKYGLVEYEVSGPVWMQYRLFGFELRTFKYRLFCLKWRFDTYRAVLCEDYNQIRMLVPDILFRQKFFGKVLSDEEALQVAKEWLCSHSVLAPIKVSPDYDKEGNRFVLASKASDILEACQVFLSLMIVSNGDMGTKLRICANEECRRYFTGHGNLEYCPNCDNRTVHSRRRRADERKELAGFTSRHRTEYTWEELRSLWNKKGLEKQYKTARGFRRAALKAIEEFRQNK